LHEVAVSPNASNIYDSFFIISLLFYNDKFKPTVMVRSCGTAMY